MSGLSWKAKRNGNIYCAPACGAGCTHAEFLTANKRADALIKKCEKEIGGKWEKRVHENLGWHYSVSLIGTPISVYEYIGREKPYHACMTGGTPIQVSTKAYSKSIRWTFNQQLKAIKNEAAIWNDHLRNIQQQLKRK